MNKNKIFYRRNMPHIQPIGATFFVTCAIKGAIPRQQLSVIREEYNDYRKYLPLNADQKAIKIAKFNARRKYVLELDNIIHNSDGSKFLGKPDFARILLARIESYHMRYYKLLALTIMPNHFHMLIDTSIQIKSIYQPETIPPGYIQLDQIMKLIKGGSARYINQKRNTEGEQVWENESFDIYMRDEKMVQNVINYILENPVKAGLVNNHEDHPFTYVNYQ